MTGPKRARRLERLGEAQNWRCCYCGCRMEFHRVLVAGQVKGRVATIEHVIPRSQGGSSGWGNTVAACADCNRGRMDAPLHLVSTAKPICTLLMPARAKRRQIHGRLEFLVRKERAVKLVVLGGSPARPITSTTYRLKGVRV